MFKCYTLQDIEAHVAFVITVPTALAIFLSIFVLVCIESIFKKLLRLFALVIWACLVAMGYLFMFFGGIICPWDQAPILTFLKKSGWCSHPIKMTKALICSHPGVNVAEHVAVVSPGDSQKVKEKSGLIIQLTAGKLQKSK
ncbi:adenylate cyclase type 2 isoform X1 [Tachysurus ichikawai]